MPKRKGPEISEPFVNYLISMIDDLVVGENH